MRWTHQDKLPNIKNTMDRYGILNRIINRNRAKINAAGAPCTYWRNTAVSALAKLPTTETKCYCWSDPDSIQNDDAQKGQPDRRHFLCSGTGYLSGYQKYGYTEIVLSTPSTFTKSSNNIVMTGSRKSAFILSGSATTAYLESERFSLTNLKDVTHLLINESIDADQNRMEYSYSTDDTTWVDLTISDYADSDVANKQADLSLDEGTEYIRFRITFKKRTTTSQSPKWNSIRFRYRKFPTLYELDTRFEIEEPAFLAAREQQSRTIEATEHGWTVKFPLEWWTLPEADIQNSDIIMFLQGSYEDYRFEVKNLREMAYGESLQILHKVFESTLIRDEHALLGIVQYLI